LAPAGDDDDDDDALHQLLHTCFIFQAAMLISVVLTAICFGMGS
jgi:hypothetical protein